MLAKEARKPTNVADCHVTAFQCHPFLQRIAGLAGWVLAATALAAFANNLISCVDGPRLARDHLACSAEVACSHVWMAPAWQEIIWRAAQRSLAVMCPACWCSPG